MKKLSSREKRGWLIVAYGVLTMASVNYLAYNAKALFLIPIAEDLCISRSALTLASTIGSLVAMFLSPFCGKIVADRRKNLKRYVILCMMAVGLLTALQGAVHRVFWLYILFGLRSAAILIPVAFCFPQFISRFIPEHAGLGCGIVMTGAALGGIVLPTPLTGLIEVQGWRFAIALCGMLCALVVAPLGILILKNMPEEGLQPQKNSSAAKTAAADFEPLKDRRFWLATGGLCICYICGTMLYHFVAALQSVGYTAQFAARLVSLYSAVNIGAKLLVGRLYDRRGITAGSLFYLIGETVLYGSAVLAWTTGQEAFAYGMSLGFGVSLVGFGTIMAPLLIKVFGPERYGMAHAKAYLFTSACSALGDQTLSLIYDTTGSYLAGWILYLALTGVTAFLFLRLSAVCKMKEKEKDPST